MQAGITEIWGSADGPVTRLAPQTRLLAGFFLFSVCMIAGPDTAIGFFFILISVLVWLAVCRLPRMLLHRVLIFGLVVFLPFFLLTPWVEVGPRSAASWFERPDLFRAVAVPWRIFARGLGGMLVSVATMSSLTTSDFYDGMRHLPLPRILVGLLMQIVQQTGTLVDETRRIAAAMAVRGAASGASTIWRILTSLPGVWLPRVIFRADRIAAAMDLRGFGPDIPCFRPVSTRLRDRIVLLSAGAWLALAVAFRIGVRG